MALSSTKVTETALSTGYRFHARNPEADPRYPSDQQLMVGPIPGKNCPQQTMKQIQNFDLLFFYLFWFRCYLKES